MLLPRGNPLFLLATVIAIAGLRPAWSVSQGHRPIDHHAHGEHVVHTHEHTHGTHTHSHRHHHHPNDPQDDGSDHHRDTLEDAPDAPKARWSAPRRVEIDAPPVTPAPHMLIAGTVADRRPHHHARPPPRGAPPPSSRPHRSIVLRL